MTRHHAETQRDAHSDIRQATVKVHFCRLVILLEVELSESHHVKIGDPQNIEAAAGSAPPAQVWKFM